MRRNTAPRTVASASEARRPVERHPSRTLPRGRARPLGWVSRAASLVCLINGRPVFERGRLHSSQGYGPDGHRRRTPLSFNCSILLSLRVATPVRSPKHRGRRVRRSLARAPTVRRATTPLRGIRKQTRCPFRLPATSPSRKLTLPRRTNRNCHNLIAPLLPRAHFATTEQHRGRSSANVRL